MRTCIRTALMGVAFVTTVLTFCGSVSGAEDESKHLYALLVLDTDAAKAAGLGIATDGRRVQRLLETAFQMREKRKRAERLMMTVLTGSDATKETIKAYYDSLPKNLGSDAILFYYSGHGGSVLDPEKGQYL